METKGSPMNKLQGSTVRLATVLAMAGRSTKFLGNCSEITIGTYCAIMEAKGHAWVTVVANPDNYGALMVESQGKNLKVMRVVA